MIVPMCHITLLCLPPGKSACLDLLGKLGIMHMDIDASDSASCRSAQERLDRIQHAVQILRDARKKSAPLPTGQPAVAYSEDAYAALIDTPSPPDSDPLAKAGLVASLDAMRHALLHEADRLDQEIERCAPFGDFDVTLPQRLTAQGIPVTLFRTRDTLTTPGAAPSPLIQILGTGRDRVTYGVAIGAGDLPEDCEAVPLSAAPLSRLTAHRADMQAKAQEITHRLHGLSSDTASLNSELSRQSGIRDFTTAIDAMRSNGTVSWIKGWLPSDQADTLREAAAANAWGLLIRDPDPGELPPTLLRPPKIFRPITCLFEALGISPSYTEADISIPFFCFFSIFFAMLVGDGGYGTLILLATLLARRKCPTAPRAPFTLLCVFSAATIIWGFLSNTWFGTHPGFADNPVSAWLNHPEAGTINMMLVCFTLGVSHLTVARAWNAAALFPDTKWLAELGWVGVIAFMYCMACGVVGIFTVPAFIYPVFGVSLLLVFLFTLKRSELKTDGITLGMMPLTIVGALGDIISYVRLFAVGLASVKVAENFNDMAINNGLPLWAKIIPMILILLIGHGLNLAMAGLGILVHAVRLNTLEFSNHKGITWAGRAFRPFRQRNQEQEVRN